MESESRNSSTNGNTLPRKNNNTTITSSKNSFAQMPKLFTEKYGIFVGHNGRLYKILSLSEYKMAVINLISTMVIGVMLFVMEKLPYYPVTVTGDTAYSYVVATYLSKLKIPYMMCRRNNRITSYETIGGDRIEFEGPSPRYFEDLATTVVPVIPNSTDKLAELEDHTGLKHLDIIQNNILDKFTRDGDAHLSCVGYLIDCSISPSGPITSIQRLFPEISQGEGDLYYITSGSNIWISRLIITDGVDPLLPNDVISGINGHAAVGDDVSLADDGYIVDPDKGVCIISGYKAEVRLCDNVCYHVHPDLTIRKHGDPQHDKQGNIPMESILYGLTIPRNFRNGHIYNLHPFHLPKTWDIFLSIMIITQALIDKNLSRAQ